MPGPLLPQGNRPTAKHPPPTDHLWPQAPELSGIGIHQLITGSDGEEAVTTARFTWGGHELLPDQQDGQPPLVNQ